MKIVSIGAGNLATHLTMALQNAGFEIVQVFSRTQSSATELSGLLKSSYTVNIGDITNDASLYIISVSDDAIESVSKNLPFINGLVIHTAGSIPMVSISDKCKNYGVLYPLQTFSKYRRVDFTEVPVFIEANSENNLEILRLVAEAISRKVYIASSVERMNLHLAAIFGCNFVNHLFHLASQISQQAGFDFSVLTPLILETVHKALLSRNPKEVQTGPAVRNDLKVMQKHIELLSSHPEWQEIYTILSENIFEST